MAYETLNAGSGPGGSYEAGDSWTPEIGSQARANFTDHETRLLTAEAALVVAQAAIAALQAVPPPGTTLLYTATASGVANLDIVTRNATGQSGAIFQTDYDEYVIECVGVLPATDGQTLDLRVSIDGGSSFVSSSSYAHARQFVNHSGTAAAAGSSSATQVIVGGGYENTIGDGGGHSTIRILNPLTDVQRKSIYGQGTTRASDGIHYGLVFYGWYLANNPVNAIRLLMSSGNIAHMQTRVYGFRKS